MPTESEILSTCRRIAKEGAMYRVHKFRYSEVSKRETLLRMKKKGLLEQAKSENPFWFFYRPEDMPVIEAAKRRLKEKMKLIHAKNVEWHLAESKKHEDTQDNPKSLYHYHIKEAEKERLLSH